MADTQQEGQKSFNMSETEMQAYAASAVETYLKTMGFDKVDAKHKVNPQGDEKVQVDKKPEERMMDILKGMTSNDAGIKAKAIAGAGTTVDADGGIFVPETIDMNIMRIINDYGVARRLFTTYPLGKEQKLNRVKLTSGVAVEWVAEGGVKPASKAAFGTITATIAKLAGITVLTQELIEDSNISLIPFLTKLFGEALALEEDRVAFGGVTSTDPFTGLFNNIAGMTKMSLAATKTAFSDLTYDDLIVFTNSLKSYHRRNAKILLSADALSAVEKLKDGNGTYIINPTAATPTIRGFQYEVIENAPTSAAGKPIMLLEISLNSTFLINLAQRFQLQVLEV